MSQYNVPNKSTGDTFSADEHNQLKTAVNSKQDALQSGTNLKTVGGQSLLGSGDIPVSGTPITIDATPTDGSPNAVSSNGVFDALTAKQATLVSGTNIKTVGGQSILGAGDIPVSGGGSLPTGGVKGDFLVKNSATANDASWQNVLAKIQPRHFYVSDFGAKQDRQYSIATGVGSSVFIPQARFVAGDVGKLLKVTAGKSNGFSFISPITAVVSPNEVTIATSVPVGNWGTSIVWGTDDQEAYQDTITAASAIGPDGRRGGVIVWGNSVLGGTVDSLSKGLLYFDQITETGNESLPMGIALDFVTYTEPPRQGANPYFQDAQIMQTGSIVESFNDTETGYLLGFRTTPAEFAPAGANWAHINIHGTILRTCYGSPMGGIDGVKLLGGLKIYNSQIDVDRSVFNNTAPLATGVSFPAYYNAADVAADNLMVYGYKRGIITNEHFRAGYIQMFGNQYGLTISGSGHSQFIERALIQGYKYGIAGDGGTVNIMQADFEITGSGQPAWYQSEYEIYQEGGTAGKVNIWLIGEGGVPRINTSRPDFEITTLTNEQINSKKYYEAGGVVKYEHWSVNAGLTTNGQAIVQKDAGKSGAYIRALVGNNDLAKDAKGILMGIVPPGYGGDPNNPAASISMQLNNDLNAGNYFFGLPSGANVGASHAVFIANGVAPTGNVAGGILYVESGALKYRGSNGTVTTLGPA